jgi:hypothetical protein
MVAIPAGVLLNERLNSGGHEKDIGSDQDIRSNHRAS